MKTVLYNTTVNTIIGNVRNGLYNDIYDSRISTELGVLPTHIIQLEVIESTLEYNPAAQIAVSQFVIDLELKQYRQEWTITDKTAFELAMELWHHPQFAKRIVAPIQLVMQYPAVETWFRINDLPIVRNGGTLYCYCNLILPAHQQLVDATQGIVTIENIPTV